MKAFHQTKNCEMKLFTSDLPVRKRVNRNIKQELCVSVFFGSRKRAKVINLCWTSSLNLSVRFVAINFFSFARPQSVLDASLNTKDETFIIVTQFPTSIKAASAAFHCLFRIFRFFRFNFLHSERANEKFTRWSKKSSREESKLSSAPFKLKTLSFQSSLRDEELRNWFNFWRENWLISKTRCTIIFN